MTNLNRASALILGAVGLACLLVLLALVADGRCPSMVPAVALLWAGTGLPALALNIWETDRG